MKVGNKYIDYLDKNYIKNAVAEKIAQIEDMTNKYDIMEFLFHTFQNLNYNREEKIEMESKYDLNEHANKVNYNSVIRNIDLFQNIIHDIGNFTDEEFKKIVLKFL